MEVGLVTLSKSDLDPLTEDERVLFIQLGTLHNELNILLKFMLMADALAGLATEPVATTHGCQSWLFVTMLALKMHEGRALLHSCYHGTQLSSKYEPRLPVKARQSRKRIDKFFDKADNCISLIRNEVAAHYSHERVSQLLSTIPNDYQSEMILSNIRGNCLFTLSRDVVMRGILEHIDPSGDKVARKKLFKEMKDVAGWFLEFIHRCLEEMLKEMNRPTARMIDLPEPEPLDESVLPFFWGKKGRPSVSA